MVQSAPDPGPAQDSRPAGHAALDEVAFRSLGGGDHLLETTTLLPLPRDRVFRFFADAGNLERITPPELRFRILTPLPVAMGEGALIDYRLALFGIPFGWRTRITAWDPPVGFVDEQLRGPDRVWEHTHRFEEVEGGTLMTDRVRFRLPLLPLGGPALPLVKVQLRRIFRFRLGAIREALLVRG